MWLGSEDSRMVISYLLYIFGFFHTNYIFNKILFWILICFIVCNSNNIDFFYFSSADWYKGQLTDKQLDDLENPPTTQKPKVKKVVSRRKHPKLQQQQSEEQTED